MPQLYSGQSLSLQFSAGGVGSTKMNHSAWQECESSSKSSQGYQNQGEGWGQGGTPHPDFGKSVTPILTRGADYAPRPHIPTCLPPPDLRPSDIQVKLAAKLARSPIIPSRVDPLRPSGPRKYNGNQGRYVNCYFFVCLNGHYQRSQTCKEPYSSIVCRLFCPSGQRMYISIKKPRQIGSNKYISCKN